SRGNEIIQLNHPTDVIVDQLDHSIIIADLGNRRVIQRLNQNRQILIENVDCSGLAMDKHGFLYISDWEKNEVRRWKMGEYNNEGTVVAGGNGQGTELNQFNTPTCIFIDKEQSVYVLDTNNHRVMKWRKDAKEGTVVAGGNGKGRNLNQLFQPQGITVDDLGQIYVAQAQFSIVRETMIEESERNTLDCTKFQRDYDIIKSLPFSVQISPTDTAAKTFALMNNNNDVTELTIYKEKFVPLNVYCLKKLISLTIHETRFYEFNLDDQTIRSIPAEIGQLTLLRTLRIYDSPVLHLPKEFGNLNQLTNLTINNSYLYDLPTTIENLSALQTLELSYNKLKTLPSTFGKLYYLVTLLLDHNELISLPSTMSSIAYLRTLDIQSNQLTSINELKNINQLRNLYAQNCNIKYLPMNIQYLINLNMSYNHLEDLFGIGTLGLAEPSQIKNFDFSYNRIDIIPPEISQIINRLQKLSVKHNQLTHLPKEIYGQLNSANTFLDISENLFTDDELNSIKATIKGKLPSIKVTY
ncbi:unnamed protein product, partial [Adineta steineri]